MAARATRFCRNVPPHTSNNAKWKKGRFWIQLAHFATQVVNCQRIKIPSCAETGEFRLLYRGVCVENSSFAAPFVRVWGRFATVCYQTRAVTLKWRTRESISPPSVLRWRGGG
jgi:hypothetical protein